MKKYITPILIGVLVISLCFNFISIIKLFKPVLTIDNESVLNRKELLNALEKKYKVNELNTQTNSYLIKKEAEKKNISAPNQKDLKDLKAKFPEMSNNAAETQNYYLYQLFNKTKNADTINKYYRTKYKMDSPELYQLMIYQTVDHNLATKIQNDLQSGKSAETVEKENKIKFDKSYTIDLDFLNEHDDKQQNDHDSHIEKIDTSNIGKVSHQMDEKGMTIIYVSKVVQFKENPEVFYDMYFSNNYQTVKTNILNKIRSTYNIKS
ncbi:hypothetical protein IGI01_26135 [Bacillus thuringiensis]|nr:hypothetical protein [Bacillus thuringiensis]